MKVLIYLGHPAHFHLYKFIIRVLKQHGHKVTVFIRTKDILEELLDKEGIPYINVMSKERGDSKFAIAFSLLKRDAKMLVYCLKDRPNLMIGSSVEITHVGKLLNIPSVITGENDIDHVKLASVIGYPLVTNLLVPKGVKVGKYIYKTNFYSGYQKIAYLHPNWFKPDPEKVKHLYGDQKQYFILRLVSNTAYHDTNESGISDAMADRIVKYLEPYGKVYINSERKIPAHLEPYRLPMPVDQIHHAMHFCTLLICDSYSMITEAAILATPSIRHTCLIDASTILIELEHKYKLTYAVPLSKPDLVFERIDEIMAIPDIKKEWTIRRDNMLKDKIDVTSFFVWYIENYPTSVEILMKDPDYDLKFR
jgi:uncharacterized protein